MNSLAKKIDENVELIILIILSLFLTFVNFYNAAGAINIIARMLFMALVLLAIWLLYIGEFKFASYFVLLTLGFLDGALGFVRWILSYNIKFGIVATFSWIDLVLLVGAIYLFIMTVGYFNEEDFKVNKDSWKLTPLLIMFAALILFAYGTQALIAVLVIEFVACFYKPVTSHLLMLSKAIAFPFTLLNTILNFGFDRVSLSTLLLAILAGYISVILIIDLLKEFNLIKGSNEQPPAEEQ